jgi:hypothetical protein
MGKIRNDEEQSKIANIGFEYKSKPSSEDLEDLEGVLSDAFECKSKHSGRPKDIKEESDLGAIPRGVDKAVLQQRLFDVLLDAIDGKPIGEIGALTPTAWIKLVELLIDRRIVPLGVIKEAGPSPKQLKLDMYNLDDASSLLGIDN